MTPTIREAFLDAFYAMSRVSTNIKNLSDIDAEIAALSGTAPFAVALLTAERARVASRIKEYEDDAIRTAAARLCLRTDDSGGCDIDLPAKRPAGRPTKTEAAARAKVGSETTAAPETPAETGTTAPEDAPPADDASGLAGAFELANEWASCAIGKAHGHAISVLGYTANELAGLGDVQIRAICKHRVTPDEYGGVAFGGVMVDGVTWLLEAPARVVAS